MKKTPTILLAQAAKLAYQHRHKIADGLLLAAAALRTWTKESALTNKPKLIQLAPKPLKRKRKKNA